MRILLVKSTITMIFIGIAILSVSFISSMGLSRKVISERSSHNISSIEKGSYRSDVFRSDQDRRVMIIHDWDGTIYTYMLPVKAGKVLMPDNYWAEYKSEYHCSDFRPELVGKGRIKKQGLIGCQDTLIPEWKKELWLWSYNGERYNERATWLPDMIHVDHEVIGKTLYVNR